MSTIVGTNIEVTNIKYDSDTTSMIISNAGQVTVQGEGTATTNLQQGIAKFWMSMDQGQTIHDSFNSSGLTDNGTGDYTVSFNNDMANTTYAAHHTATDANTNTAVLVGVTKGSAFAAGSLGVYVLNEDTGASDGSNPSSISVLGDLA